MAEPKKETVRIALPPRPEPKVDPQNGDAKRDTARIVLPSRTPVLPPRRPPIAATPPAPVSAEPAPETPLTSLRRPPVQTTQPSAASPVLQPLPKPAPPPPAFVPPPAPPFVPPPAPPAPPASVTPLPKPGSFGVSPGPKKETARITILPKPVPLTKPAVNMTKTQPLIMRPAASSPASPVVVATSTARDPFDSISRPLCWALLGTSALIFIIQIWNYAVS
ncbi:MAG: hypothetical protein QOH88_267 [Verrucomicrobiota bacterium]